MENKQIMGFDVKSELGTGAFSTTMLAEKEGKKVVIKVIEFPNEATLEEYPPEYIKGPEFTAAIKTMGTDINRLLKSLTMLHDTTGVLKCYDYKLSFNKKTDTYNLSILEQYATPLPLLLKSKGIPVGAALKMGSQLCEGLELMYNKLIFHGNIKESNVFYNSEDGSFVLSDYNINDILSLTLLPNKGFTSYGYRFLAPEAYDDEEYSFKTDIFCLGIMIYKILNKGRLPFDTTGRTSMKKIKEKLDAEKILPPPAIDIPEITKVLRKATAYNKDERFPSFYAFKAALDRLIATVDNELLYTKIELKKSAEAKSDSKPVQDKTEAKAKKPAKTSDEKAKGLLAQLDADIIDTADEAPVTSAKADAPAFEKSADTQAKPLKREKAKSKKTAVKEERSVKAAPATADDLDDDIPSVEEAMGGAFDDDDYELPPIVTVADAPSKPTVKAKDENYVNPLIPPDDYNPDEADDASKHKKVRQLEHYVPKTGVTKEDALASAYVTLDENDNPILPKKRIKSSPDTFNYFDYNSEETSETSKGGFNKRTIIITAIILGASIVTVAAGFLVKFFLR